MKANTKTKSAKHCGHVEDTEFLQPLPKVGVEEPHSFVIVEIPPQLLQTSISQGLMLLTQMATLGWPRAELR